MFYVFVQNGTVQQSIPAIDPAFPDIPIEQRFQPELLAMCVKSEREIPLGWYYDPENGFTEEPPYHEESLLSELDPVLQLRADVDYIAMMTEVEL